MPEVPAWPEGVPLPSHYDVLGVARDADEAAIRTAYRDLLLKCHPDVDSSPGAQAQLKLITRAFETLSKPELRAEYDSFGAGAPASPKPQEKTEMLAPALQPALERTEAMPPQQPSAEEENRRLAQELARRGVSMEEAARLSGAGPSRPAKRGKRSPIPPAMSDVTPRFRFEPKPTIVLPPIRSATAEEQAGADRLLTMANLARRRGKFAEAEKFCLEAVQLTPSDAGALELYGDVLQELGRVDDSLAAYKQALDVDSSRVGAEKKYAELMLLQDRSIAVLRREEPVGNPRVAVFLSALFPGAGQVSKGQTGKALVFAALMAGLAFAFFYTDFGMPGSVGTISPSMVVIVVLAVVLYVYNLVDASSSRVRRGGESGWDV